ncbi:YphA family membrane protein [Tuberibacillus sp. Marseille-P3662]|uniref:YphA family membrane protein n=1 Tax=Tuberibacillus sp. Marseille-P3662 TaxID=1965358 RepID=UPI000A1CCA64|nr:hypothetical protein [Tuberibacillus sp. Marseille-P3662]
MPLTIFYWAMWSLWVYFTFLAKKNRTRDYVVIFLLASISCATFSVSIPTLDINVTYLLFLFVGLYLFRPKKMRLTLYYVFIIFSLMLLYVLYYIYVLYDPAIFLLFDDWALAIGLFLIICLLVKDHRMRCASLIMGQCMGEFLRVVVFYRFDHTVGHAGFLNQMAMVLVLVVAGHTIGNLTKQWHYYMASRVQSDMNKQSKF